MGHSFKEKKFLKKFLQHAIPKWSILTTLGQFKQLQHTLGDGK